MMIAVESNTVEEQVSELRAEMESQLALLSMEFISRPFKADEARLIKEYHVDGHEVTIQVVKSTSIDYAGEFRVYVSFDGGIALMKTYTTTQYSYGSAVIHALSSVKGGYRPRKYSLARGEFACDLMSRAWAVLAQCLPAHVSELMA